MQVASCASWRLRVDNETPELRFMRTLAMLDMAAAMVSERGEGATSSTSEAAIRPAGLSATTSATLAALTKREDLPPGWRSSLVQASAERSERRFEDFERTLGGLREACIAAHRHRMQKHERVESRASVEVGGNLPVNTAIGRD